MSSETPSLDGDLREWREAIIEKCREALVGGNEERYAAAKDAAAAAESRIRTTVRALHARIGKAEAEATERDKDADFWLAESARLSALWREVDDRYTRLLALIYEGEDTCAWLRSIDAGEITSTLDRYAANSRVASVRSQEDSANG